FFCDFQGELADAVRRGRRREFAQAYAQYGDAIPDPLSEATFRSAILDWDAPETPSGRKRLGLVRDLLAIRRRELVPRLAGTRFGSARRDGPMILAEWRLGDGTTLSLIANLSNESVAAPRNPREERPLWSGALPTQLPPWFVHWSIGARD